MTHEHDAGEDKKETGFVCSCYLPDKAFTQKFSSNKESIEKFRENMRASLDGDGQKKLWNFLTQAIVNFSTYSQLRNRFKEMLGPQKLEKLEPKEGLSEPQSDPTNDEEKRTFLSIFYFSFYDGANPVDFLESLRESLRKIYPTEFEAIPVEVKAKCELLFEDKNKKKEPSESLSSSSQFPKQNNHQSPKIAPQTVPGYPPQAYLPPGYPPRSSSVGSQPTVLKRPAASEAERWKRQKQGFVSLSSSDTQERKGEEEVKSDNPSTELQDVQKSTSPALTPPIVLE